MPDKVAPDGAIKFRVVKSSGAYFELDTREAAERVADIALELIEPD